MPVKKSFQFNFHGEAHPTSIKLFIANETNSPARITFVSNDNTNHSHPEYLASTGMYFNI